MFEIDRFMDLLNKREALRDADEIHTDVVDRIQPQSATEWPDQLDPRVRNAMVSAGIPKLYKHQADAIDMSLSGADVVMESPTASGKTAAFTAPMLHSLLVDRGSYALMIYPMKALAFDQREQIRRFCEPLGIESFSYDGDTDPEHRQVIRNSPVKPHILMTNPEYLNMSFLAWREQWDGYLRNLKYVIVDEMHEYRGFFGGNMALLLRRFFLHLDRIGASPQVFMSTATCANPQEHAKNLTGRDLEMVSARDVLRPKRHFIFVNPDIPDHLFRDILRLRVEQAALTVLEQELQALVFCPTKRFLEEAFRRTQRKAEELGLDKERISAFHADLKNEDRQRIQERLKKGLVNVAFTTNALELGLDIGGLDGVILAGFPPSIMSAWQQIGRAGRGWDKDAFVLFYSMNDPIDRFFVGNLPAFLNKPFDELVIDPANEELIGKHLPMLAAETEGALYPQDADILGGAFYDAAQRVKGTVPKGFKPHPRLNIRGGMGSSFDLKIGNEKVGQISAARRFREAYIGAIFPFFGKRYRVHSHEEDAVVLAEAEQNMRTDAGFFTVLNIQDIKQGFGYGDIEVYYGTLSITTNFTGYKLVEDISGEVKGEGGTTDAHFMNSIHSFWINVPQSENAVGGIGALEHMLRVGAMFVIPADRFDTSTYSKGGDDIVSYYYENYSGGIGVAKKLFERWPTVLEKGIEVAASCRCRMGCQNCIEPAKSYNVSNADIDKARGIELARELLAIVKDGPDRRFENGLMLPV